MASAKSEGLGAVAGVRCGAAAAVALCAAGCAGSVGPGAGFDLHYPDNRPAEVGTVASAIEARRPPEGPALVALTVPPPAHGLVVFSLPDGQRRMQTSAAVDARPALVMDLVLSHVPGFVVAWNVRMGAELWRLPDHGYSLLGAGGDEQSIAVSLGPGNLSSRHGHFAVLDPLSGRARYSRDVEQALGVPTAAGDYAFVPWNGQYLSVIDLTRGEEATRIRTTDDIFGRALREGPAVYFGARALYRLSSEAGAGRREGAGAYVLPRADLPGNPPLMVDGYSGAYAGYNARERVAVVLRPDPARPASQLVDDQLYALYHRVVFALDAHDGAVRWAYVSPADVAGAEPVRGGLALVDEQGHATLLDARAGNPVWRRTLGTTAAQAVLHLPLDFSPPRENGEDPQPQATTLLSVAGATDDRLLPARVFAVNALARVPGDDATRGLLDVASRRNYPQALRAAAGEALAQRTDGVDAMLAALDTHYDYVRQSAAPPVGFVARALAHAHERRAVAPLLAHLADPGMPAADLPPVVAALKDLADPSAVPALLDFLRLYHADEGPVQPVGGGDPINDRSIPDQQAIASALEQAAAAVHQLGDARAQRWLRYLADDPNTVEPARTAMQRALAPAPEAAADGHHDGATGASPEGTDTASAPGIPPARLSRELIRDGFAPAHEAMMHCLDHASSRPSQVRLSFRYDGAGALSNVTVTPAQFAPCIAPIAAGVHLPASQVSQEIGTYYLLGDAP